jgi:hypothetical protein
VLVLAVLLMGPASAGGRAVGAGGKLVAAWPTLGSEIRISGLGALGDEWYPDVAYNPVASEFLVVWQDRRNGSSRGWDIYGQRVSAAGSLVGGEFRISGPGATSDETEAAVAYGRAANEYLVVWADGRTSISRGSDIYGQRVSATGSLVGANFPISGTAAVGADLWPAVAYDSAEGAFLVVWQDDRKTASRGSDIYGQRVSVRGYRVGANFRVSGPGATAREGVPALAYNSATHEFLVVWWDLRDGGPRRSDIYGRRVSASGTPVDEDFRVAPPGQRRQYFPAVAFGSGIHQYLVVWQDVRPYYNNPEIYGRRVSGWGSPRGPEFPIPGYVGSEVEPAVAHGAAADEFLVVWSDWRDAPWWGSNVYGRRVSSLGALVGDDFPISVATLRDKYTPAVAYNSSRDEFLVVWSDHRDYPTRGADIYARRVAG